MRLSILFIIRDIDGIVLTYVISILEDLVEESDPSQAFDSDSFMEMIVAYLPLLEGVDVSTLVFLNDEYLNILPQETKVTEWMIKVVSDIKNSKEEKFSYNFDLKSLIEKTTSKTPVKNVRSVSETSEPEVNNKKRSNRLSETSEAGSSDEAEIEAGVATLLEMFPSCSKVEAVHCLTIKGGDMERAAQMILTRMEMGEDIKLSQAEVNSRLSESDLFEWLCIGSFWPS